MTNDEKIADLQEQVGRLIDMQTELFELLMSRNLLTAQEACDRFDNAVQSLPIAPKGLDDKWHTMQCILQAQVGLHRRT